MVDPISTEQILQHAERLRSQQQSLGLGDGKETATTADGGGFGDVLSKMIGDVDQAQKEADLSLEKMAAGENNNIQDVVLKLEQADISFKLMKSVRDKLLTAYKEVMAGQA